MTEKSEYGLLLLGLGSQGLFKEPVWVLEFDPNVHADNQPYPTGWVVSTTDPEKAKRFPTKKEAIEYWNQQSTAVPLRPDGRPNKPLTAYTVEIKEIPCT